MHGPCPAARPLFGLHSPCMASRLDSRGVLWWVSANVLIPHHSTLPQHLPLMCMLLCAGFRAPEFHALAGRPYFRQHPAAVHAPRMKPIWQGQRLLAGDLIKSPAVTYKLSLCGLPWQPVPPSACATRSSMYWPILWLCWSALSACGTACPNGG